MMGSIWLMWCGRDSYVEVRHEIKSRGGASRFVRLSGMSDVTAVVDGFADERLSAAVFVGNGGVALDTAERLLGELGRTGRMQEIVACMHEVEAGIAARCFHAGATEVIAVGSSPRPDVGADGACREEEALLDAPDVQAAAREFPMGDDLDEPADSWGEMPPWDEVPSWEEPSWEEAPSWAGRSAGEVEVIDVEAAVPVEPEHRAPVVTVISGRGGVGKTTLVAAMAACGARAGLRVAVLDLDLMFGNLPEVFGVEAQCGIEAVGAHACRGALAEADIEGAAMRIGPGLTLWGPCLAPERAEVCAASVEQLVGVLRGVADVILVDTSSYWGDAVAMAVSVCDRCLVVGGAEPTSATSGRRVVDLATRLGVPRTKMTCVFNRMGARGCGEEQALAFEMGTALRSRVRIVDGGDEVAGMMSFGQVNGLVAGSGAFAQSVRTFTSDLLQELGCPIAQWLLDEEQRRKAEGERVRFRLPWRRRAGDML